MLDNLLTECPVCGNKTLGTPTFHNKPNVRRSDDCFIITSPVIDYVEFSCYGCGCTIVHRPNSNQDFIDRMNSGSYFGIEIYQRQKAD